MLEHETRAEWYLRQMLGAANFDAGPVLAFSSGNLCYQIEHHLFPDLPSNRYAQIAVRVRALCDKYDLPYTSGSLVRQYLLDAANHPQTGASRRLPDGDVRRRTGNRFGTEIRRRREVCQPTGWPDHWAGNGAADPCPQHTPGTSGHAPARDYWRLASAAPTVSTAGSDPWGSQSRSSRETAAPGTTTHPLPSRAQHTEILCSAEKPSMPKNSRPLRSRINPLQRTAFASA